MAYRRPGIRVTQEFVDVLPGLAAFNLPNCIVGPAYQVVSNDELGSYTGSLSSYTYVSLMPGAIVDTNILDENELTDHQYPIGVTLTNVRYELQSSIGTGYVSTDLSTEFNDATLNVFSNVIAGDELEILVDDIEIIASQTNGTVTNADPDTLVGTSGQYANAVAGDTVTITGGTNVTTGTYTVVTKVDPQTLVLDASFYTGGTTSLDVAYRIDRTTGTTNAATYVVREVLSVNQLKLQGELPEAETLLSYRIIRKVNELVLERDTHFTADDATIELFAALQVNSSDIVSAAVNAKYRALRIDHTTVTEYKTLSDIQADFGVDQVVPANPLAYGLSIGLQNTVTAVNGLGLGVELLTNEQQAYQKALDTLKRTDMYALVPLTQSPVVHQLFSTHVTQMSAPEKGLERVAICNRKLVEQETLVDTNTTDGFRVIVNTQTAGIVVLGDNTISFATALFGSVQKGDIVHIVGGTGVAVGEYPVNIVVSNLQLELTGFVATYNGTDVEFYITRADGIEANGTVFYDSNQTFITDGVVAGFYLVIEAGAYAGRHLITTVSSNNKLSVVQIPGITSVTAPITYRIEKDMTKAEMAEFMKAYGASFLNRRLVVSFPDIVKIPEGSVTRELPGFYKGCSVGALTTGLPTQQGFTNLTVSGFIGMVHGSEFFDEDQLDTMADGGIMIFDQDVPESALYIRHELTTDRSAIKFQEYMVTKNVDFIAKFLRNTFKDFIGRYNVIDATFDEMKTRAQSAIRFLRDNTVQDRIGGVVKGGQLVKLEEGVNIDTIDMRFKFDIPIPLNNIDITIQV